MTDQQQRPITTPDSGSAQSIARSWSERGRRVQAAVMQIRAQASSRNGEVDVTVDARGNVLDIRLTPHALDHGCAQLSQFLAETIRDAQHDAARRVEQAWQPLTSDPAVREILDFGKRLAKGSSPAPRTAAEGQLPWDDEVRLHEERIKRQLGRY